MQLASSLSFFWHLHTGSSSTFPVVWIHKFVLIEFSEIDAALENSRSLNSGLSIYS